MLKKKFPFQYLFFLFFLFSCTGQKKDGSSLVNSDNIEFCKSSGIEIPALSNEQIEDLAVLGKIWGFLKYYHPTIAEGSYNWDYELFRILPEIINADSKRQRDRILINWIEKIGSFKHGDILKKNENIILYPDLNWIDISGFDPKLVKLLHKIKYAKRNSEHYYVELNPHVGNPLFKREDSYASIPFSDVGYRLLCLFRYWNMINYYFPYKNLMDVNWEQMLFEFIPKYINVETEFEYLQTALEMTTKINDSHAFFYYKDEVFKKFGGNKIVPIEIIFLGDTAVIAGFFENDFEKLTTLNKGDVIVKINDKSIQDIIKERAKYVPASNNGALLRDIASDLLLTYEKSLKIEYYNGLEVQQTEVPTYYKYSISVPDQFHKADTCFKFITPNISYLYLGSIKNEYLSDLWKYIENTDGLIIDLRCYPSDFTVFSLSDYLMNDYTEFVKFSIGSITQPGMFTYTPVLKIGRKNKEYYKGKIAILVNEMTQSQAEYTAMAFRNAPKAKVFGSPTAGADGDISYIDLSSNIKTAISGIGIYYPDGKETQRIGILPDIEVKPTIKGIKEGKDEVLEKAIEWINEK